MLFWAQILTFSCTDKALFQELKSPWASGIKWNRIMYILKNEYITTMQSYMGP